MASFVKLANGNWQGDVQLMPEAYEALQRAAERQKGTYVDILNVSIMTYVLISEAAAEVQNEASR